MQLTVANRAEISAKTYTNIYTYAKTYTISAKTYTIYSTTER